MKIEITLNAARRKFYADPWENVQKFLQNIGINSVREGDGFTGADTILLDGRPVYAGLMNVFQINGHDVKTIEWLKNDPKGEAIFSAMTESGIVQDGYNSPAAALMIADLLNRVDEPKKEDIKDALSGLFIRDSGYVQYFEAVETAKKRLKDPKAKPYIPQEFMENLRDIGKVRPKVDGYRLVTGERVYVEDMVRQGSLVLKVLRSPYAHAYIEDIDTKEAMQTEGAVMIITHKDCPDVYYTQAGQGFPEPSPYDRRMFSKKVRHVGDRVAAVIAETEEEAIIAMEKIKVKYKKLEPVLSIEEACKPSAPIVHDSDVFQISGDGKDTGKEKIIYCFGIGADPQKNIAASVSDGIGDIEKGFDEAHVVIDREYRTSAVQPSPPETHVVYSYTEGDRVIIHASTQVPWHIRKLVARVLGISENKIRVKKERVGGGYGTKQDIFVEDLCAYAAYKTKRPVFFKLTREEEFTTTSTRHPMNIRVKIGAKKDGTITAIYMQVNASTGPYGNHCLTVPMNSCSKSLPLFKCDNIKFDVTCFYTNTIPTGAYQGYGAPQGSFALQAAVTELAAKLGKDPVQVLKKNMIREGDLLEILKCLGEGRKGAAVGVMSCGLDRAMEKGIKTIDWNNKTLQKDSHIKTGKGVAIVQQGSGLPGLDQSNASVTLFSDGSIMVHSGGTDLGTGLDTVCVKIAAETLCVDMENVSIVSGDTDHTPYDTGAYASSGTFFSGSAVLRAAQDLKQKIIKAAVDIIKENEEDIEIQYPGIIKGKKQTISFKTLANKAESGTGVGHLKGLASFTTHDASIPYAVHFCEVQVDTLTGIVKVLRYHVYTDCGTPINPDLARAQAHGGVLKAIGHTLWEELKLDESGKCINPNFQDYNPPTIGDIPEDFIAEFIHTDDPFGPFGAKSVSEVSTNGSAPAIFAAIHDAVGVWIRSWPFSPEKVLSALGG